GLSTRLFFSRPAIMRSIAAVKSSSVTASPLRRVATMAASLTRLARSAPVKPGVRPATWSRSTLAASCTLATCTFRISSRPVRSGRSTTTWRSNRPGRSRAGSSTSGRLVAASGITPVLGSMQQGPQGAYVYVINADSTVAVRPVKVAQVSGGQALIDSGLSRGEQVVVDGQYKLQPGIHVTILHGKAAEEAAAQDAQRTPIP